VAEEAKAIPNGNPLAADKFVISAVGHTHAGHSGHSWTLATHHPPPPIPAAVFEVCSVR